MQGYNSSSNSDCDNDLSDLADPLHDEEILEELFYKEVSKFDGTTAKPRFTVTSPLVSHLMSSK